MRYRFQGVFKRRRTQGESSIVNWILLVGLLASISVVYVLNYSFYISVSNITSDMKDITSMLTDMDIDLVVREIGKSVYGHNKSEPCSWPPNSLNGREPLDKWEFDMDILNEFYPFMNYGHYSPTECIANKKVAIIVPYRDREPQLKIFLNNVIPRINRQKQEFGIYIIEQTSGTPFNRGMLANIGYKEAMDDLDYDCIVIHDLDILPEDDRNFYTCADNPIHMAVKVEQFRYKLVYDEFAGGITSFSSEQYKRINGFSNQFFGWGGEDDDLYNRHEILENSYRLHDKDGLNNLNYTVIEKSLKQLYVLVFVHIDMKLVQQGVKNLMKKSRKRRKPGYRSRHNLFRNPHMDLTWLQF